MSLNRFIYYSAIVGGWAAFLGWLLAECLFRGEPVASWQVAVVAALVGGAIGAGLNIVSGMANGQWRQLLQRLGPGITVGGIGGAVGGLLGNLLYGLAGSSAPLLWLMRSLGWAIMGVGIGVVDGLSDRSRTKLRNGLIGGGLGGLIGGMLFDPIRQVIQSGSGMSSRATAFVILGLCIGALIGLVQVILKEAWLTVLDGYRAGRQLILSQPVTSLGRSDRHALPFLGEMNRAIEPDHVRLIRDAGGNYLAEDNRTKLGTRVNGKSVTLPTRLQDGDVIQFGPNAVRFNEKRGKA